MWSCSIPAFISFCHVIISLTEGARATEYPGCSTGLVQTASKLNFIHKLPGESHGKVDSNCCIDLRKHKDLTSQLIL